MREATASEIHRFHFTFKALAASLIQRETVGAGRWQIISLKDILTRLNAAGVVSLKGDVYATLKKKIKKSPLAVEHPILACPLSFFVIS